MKNDTLGTRILALTGAVLLTLAAYILWARPYQLHWGATGEEVQRPMPGDELDSSPTFQATRAITIDATPQQIWPWLMQMGYGRAGSYGYDLFKNVGSPSGPRSADRLLPQFQNFKVGDPVPISPGTTLEFYAIVPDQYIVWSGAADGRSFAWALYAVGDNQTRLVSRVHRGLHWSQPLEVALGLLTEFTDHLAARKALQGLKNHVEGHIQPESDLNIEFFVYVGSALAFVWAALSMLRLPPSWGTWFIGLAGGLAWLISWYAPGSIWTGAVLAFLVIWAVRVRFRDLQQTEPQPPVRSKARKLNRE